MSSKKIISSEIHKLLLIIWTFYFTIPQFIVMILLQEHGVIFAYTGFFWLFWILIAAMLVITIKYWAHPIVTFLRPFIFIVVGYLFARYLIDPFIVLTPGFFIVNVVGMAFIILNEFASLRDFFKLFFKKRMRDVVGSFAHPRVKKAIVILLIYFGLMSWSYFGFSQTVLIEDPHPKDFKISFWGLPMGGLNWEEYQQGIHDEELTLYTRMHSSFYMGVSVNTFNNTEYLDNLAKTLAYFSKFNISIIFNLNPIDPESGKGDFVTYWYVDQVNACMNALIDWMFTLNSSQLSAIRGFSLDVEGPIYDKPISVDQFWNASYLYQLMFDRFRALFPGKQALLIQTDQILFDHYDGDHDLDIQQKTITEPPLWDYYGFMTYRTGSVVPSCSHYKFYYYGQMGVARWGRKFQPWIGWLYDPQSEDDPNVIENPVVYKHFMEQVKIAKSLDVEEIVIAPVRNFYGRNHTEGLQRVYDLYSIYQGFEPFRIAVTQNPRLYGDLNEYFKHFNPFYFYANQDVFKDLMLNMDDGWICWVEILQSIIIVLGYIALKKEIIIIDKEKLKNLGRHISKSDTN